MADRQQQAWAAGAEGERLVAASLAPLELDGWILLHDVRWPGRDRANLDHVAVGPGGVVVVDSKNWSGEVTVDDGVLRVGTWRKDHELDAVASAVADVAALLPSERRHLVRGALCLVQHDITARPTSPGVAVVGRGGFAATLRSLPTRLAPADVAEVADTLRTHLLSPPSPGRRETRRRRTSLPRRRPAGRRATRGPRTRSSTGGVLLDGAVRIGIVLVIAWFAVTQLPELGNAVIASQVP